jgi:uncharacterized protein
MAERIDVSTYRFQWDEAKNHTNFRKHGLDFTAAEEMFHGILLTKVDAREDYGEKRLIGIGTAQGRTLVVVFTERGPGNIRIISLRKAKRRESEAYEKAVQDRLEAD